MADVQEVIASLNLDKKCLSLFPWKEGGEPDDQHILFIIVLQACIRHLRHGGLFAVFLFHTSIRENLKYRCLKPNFIEFSSTTLASLFKSLWKLLANTDPHVFCSTGDGHHKHQHSQKSMFMPTGLLQLVLVILNLRTGCIF